MDIGTSYTTKRCPDGTPRLLLKNLKDIPQIFGEYVPEWSYKVNQGLKASKEAIESSTSVDATRTAKTLYNQISTIDYKARTLFRTAYIQYTTNPCGNDKYLNDKVDEIFRLVDKLSEIDGEVEKLKIVGVKAEGQPTGAIAASRRRTRIIKGRKTKGRSHYNPKKVEKLFADLKDGLERSRRS